MNWIYRPTLTPAGMAGPAVLVLGQPVLHGTEVMLAKYLPASVSPWTSAACKGASFGLGVASLASAVSDSITLLPAIAIGAAGGAILGIAGRLLHLFFTRTRMGMRLQEIVAKTPSVIATPARWVFKIGRSLFGNGDTMSAAGTTSILRRPLLQAMNTTGLIGRAITTVALLKATLRINDEERQTTLVGTIGAGLVAGAAVAAPILLSTPMEIEPIRMVTKIAFAGGITLMVAGAFVGASAMAGAFVEGVHETAAGVAAAVAAAEAQADAEEANAKLGTLVAETTAMRELYVDLMKEPATIKVVDPAGEVTEIKVPVEPMIDVAYSATTTINAAAAAATAEPVLFNGPATMSADLYTAALDRMVAEGKTVEQAVEALKPPAKQSRGQRRAARQAV